MALVQFISERQVDLPSDFIDMYLENKHLNGKWIHSELAHEWLKEEYSRYDNMIRAMKNWPPDMWKDHDQSYQNLAPLSGGVKKHGGQTKKYYLLSSELYKALAMKNMQKRLYYVKLEQIMNDYEEHCKNIQQQQLQQERQQNQEQQFIIEQQQAQIEAFEAMKKRGVIYEIFYKGDQNENYIGCHQGIDPKERLKTHINAALQSLKLPLYKRIFREGLKHFDIRSIEYVDYHNADELFDAENKVIEDKNPSLNRGFQFICNCGRELTQEGATFNHRETCQLYVKNPYIDPFVQMGTHI